MTDVLQDKTRKNGAIKKGPQPPDSLIPDSLIQKPLSGKPDVTHPEQWDFKLPPPPGQDCEYVIAFLNRISGAHFQAVEPNLKLVRARLREASVADIKRVIVVKCEQWEGNPEMEEYVRPKTLFNATNFAQYLGALPHADA